MAKTRKIFIYLAVIAVILGLTGLAILSKGKIASKAVEENQKKQQVYALEKVAEHNSRENCWIYLNDKVYDITLFLQVYPEDLSRNCGKDAGNVFSKAKDLLEEYHIGILK